MFWAMAPLSVVFGRPAWATVVAAALLQGAAIAAAAWLAWRRGGLSLLLVVGAVIALSYRAMGDSAFVTAWGPNVAFPFFVLFLLLIWDVVNGHVRTLIPATAVGTFLVQAHVGYAPLVGVLGGWALVVAIQRSRHDPAVRARGSLRSTLLWSGAVAAILWAPALIETVLYPPGNLYRIARRFTGVSGEPSAGLRSGLGFLAAEFRLLPPWLGGRELQDPATGASAPASLVYLIIPIALLVIGFAAARVSGSRQHQRLLVMVALLVPTSVLAMSRSAVPTDRYLFWWREIIAVFLVAAVGLAVAGALGATERPWFRMVAGTALALVVVVGSVSLAVETNRESKAPAAFALVQRTLGQIESRPLPHGPVLVRQVGNEWEVYAALVDELERRGVPIRVDSGFQEERFGESRHATTEHVDQVWIVVQDGWLVSDLVGRRDAVVLARSTPLTDEDEAELVGIQQHLASTLRTANRTDLLPELDSPTPEAELRDATGLDATRSAGSASSMLVPRPTRTGAPWWSRCPSPWPTN